MCGLVGLITSTKAGFLQRDVEIFKQMLYVDMLRGEDATGICVVNNQQGAIVHKEASEAIWFLDKHNILDPTFKESLKSGKAFLGHNRKATVGKKTDTNAHPFVYEDRYVFFHNGTLNNHKTFGDDEVDSESFGRHIVAAEGDIDKTGEVFNKAFGAWACVWYDSEKHTVYFNRNAQRPLSFVYLKNGDIAYSSEAWMAQAIAQRNAVQIEKVESLDVDTLYSIDLTTYPLTIKKDPLPKKVTAQSTTTVSPGKIVPTKTITLGKHQRKAVAKKLASIPFCTFFIVDAISNSLTGQEDPSEVYDWLVSGFNAMYPGVEFNGTIKNMFPYEIEQMMGLSVVGEVKDVEDKNGKVMVWLSNISEQGVSVN